MLRLILLPLFVVATISGAVANSGGRTRSTLFNGQGCGACHGGSSSPSTSLSVVQAVDNKISVSPGQTIKLDIVIANASLRESGINIGMKASKTSETNVGTLALFGSQSSLRTDFSGELTHSSPRPLSNGIATYSFLWTAPSEEGSVFLRATGNAVDRNGSPSGDQWNFMQPVEIVVGSVSSVPYKLTTHATQAYPLPAAHNVYLDVEATAGESFNVRVTSASGATQFSDVITSQSEMLHYGWPCTSSSGIPVPNGTYFIALSNERRSIFAKAIIQR